MVCRATTGGQIFVADETAQAATVEWSIRPQAVALGLFALILAVTALLVVGQAASRQLLAASRIGCDGLVDHVLRPASSQRLRSRFWVPEHG